MGFSPILAHKLCMTLATLIIIVGVIIARRKKNNWIKTHRLVMLIGVIVAYCGLTSIEYFKLTFGFPHFVSVHSWVGTASIVLITIVPIFGILTIAGKERFRMIHKRVGHSAKNFMFFAAIFGILTSLGLIKK